MSCGVDCRLGSDLVLLWRWCRPGATALIRPLAWEPPYASDAALEKDKKKGKKKKKKWSKLILIKYFMQSSMAKILSSQHVSNIF